jgi:uncharacterized protein YjaZ
MYLQDVMSRIRIETVSKLLDLIERTDNSEFSQSEIENLYNHPDYQIEVSRYKTRDKGFQFPTSSIINSILQIHSGFKTSGDTHSHLRRVMQIYNDLEYYKSRLPVFIKDPQTSIVRATDHACSFLPESCDINPIEILITVGIGESFGWPFKNIIHFDYVKLVDDFSSYQELENLLAHELHHIGFQNYLETIDFESNLSVFLHFLAYEGMAIKFFNHPTSLFSEVIDPEKENYQISLDDWTYYKNNYRYYFELFKSDVSKILEFPEMEISGLISHWMSSKRIDGSEKELTQYPNYFFGSELIGMFLTKFTIADLYEILRSEQIFINTYNDILRSIGMNEFQVTK